MRHYAENMMPKLFILLWKQDSVFHLSSGPHCYMVTWRISHTCSLLLIRFVKLEMLIYIIAFTCRVLESAEGTKETSSWRFLFLNIQIL